MRTLSLLTLLLLAACAQPVDTGAAGGEGAALSGRIFLSTAVVRDGKPHDLVKGTRIRLSFEPDGRIGAHAGCNSMGGAADLDGGRLHLGDGVSVTDMGCDEKLHQQDAIVAAFLQDDPRWELSGDVLTLRTDTMQLTMRDQETADPDRPLAGTRWQVDTVIDGAGAGSAPVGPTAYLEFADGTVQGSTGCNQLHGRAVAVGDTITFGGLTTTKKGCPDDVNRLERAVLETLTGAVTWKVTADRLSLTGPGGHGLQLRAVS